MAAVDGPLAGMLDGTPRCSHLPSPFAKPISAAAAVRKSFNAFIAAWFTGVVADATGAAAEEEEVLVVVVVVVVVVVDDEDDTLSSHLKKSHTPTVFSQVKNGFP
jgi:hypothetical protein